MAKAVEKLVLFTVSTCGLGSDDLGTDSKEICLLAWQVIDCSKIQPATLVEYCYIRPSETVQEEETPVGIETRHLRKAPLINEGLKKLHSIFSSFPENSYCLATNGILPLRQCVFPEMTRKNLSIPQFCHMYFDLRNEVTKRTNGDVNPGNLREMCEYLGVDCSVTDVHGEEEIRVLARVVQKMLSQGHVFESPEVIDGSYEPASQLESGITSDGVVVRLKGLPFQADYKDVAGFLAGLNIVPGGIVFCINAVGRRTGEAIVVLENEEHASLALKRDRHYLGKRYVEVFEGSAEEFMELVGDAPTGDCDQVFVARLQGLPFKASEEDICAFFGNDAAPMNGSKGVFIVLYANGRASGGAFVLFDKKADLQQAMKKDKQDMMGRYIELYVSSLKEFLMVLSKAGTPEQMDIFSFLDPQCTSGTKTETGKKGTERNCVKLRGLPWESTAEDVIEFFDDMSKFIELHGVHMVLNSQNRPTGDCYVQMTSVDSASKAAERLHKRNMGRRYIEVFQCSGNEVTYALTDSAKLPSSSRVRPDSTGKGARAGTRVKAKGLPYSANELDLVTFFADYGIEENDVEIIYNQSGRSTGLAAITFSSSNDAKRAVKDLDNKYIGDRYVKLSLM